ncbi:auxin efflux carrier transmembrane protein [Mycena olivaceomarginata]|nr:auxin efflux carrier transmembrane protein [Mycena olivaceomarginata]
MLSAGQLIWTSCRPLFRLIICTGCGFILTRADLFPAVAAQGTSQILLNITYPCLMFSKIVPSFSVGNISALVLGGLVAWLVSQFFWVPHRFRWGILVAGVWGNVGDIPTAVVLSIMGAAPFNGSADQTLSVGYISGFLFVGVITFFPLGGNRLVALDYVGPDVEREDVKETMRLKRRRILVWPRLAFRRLAGRASVLANDLHEKSDPIGDVEPAVNDSRKNSDLRPPLSSKHVSFSEPADEVRSDLFTRGPSTGWQSRITSPAPTMTAVNTQDVPDGNTILPTSASAPPIPQGRPKRLTASILTFLRNLLIPPSFSIPSSCPSPPSISPPPPTGSPPLAFMMDAATFIGAASVPMGLVCLGSALARLRVPRGSWDTLPVGAILAFSVGKLLVFPVIGVLLCKGLVGAGVIAGEDKVLQLFASTATTQVFVTQVASGTGDAQDLSAFLIPQYALMLVSMTALTAYALQTLF